MFVRNDCKRHKVRKRLDETKRYWTRNEIKEMLDKTNETKRYSEFKKKNYETQRFACLEIKKYRPCKRFKFDFTIFYNDANKSEFEIKNLSELIEQL